MRHAALLRSEQWFFEIRQMAARGTNDTQHAELPFTPIAT